MDNILSKIKATGIIPVVVIENEKDALPLAAALNEGGITCAEVTFRTKAAASAIRIMKDNYPDMLIGAGTVLTREQVDEATAAGAEFIVSPGLNPKVVTYALDKGSTVIPGTSSASDIETALDMGLATVKFFPAEAIGGVKLLKALSAPYREVSFMPTGGIGPANVRDYLSLKSVIACGGSWMAAPSLIGSGDFDEIRRLTREAADIVEEIKFDRV